MEKLPKVNVIMSTYNGEKFVRQQIDSILAQKDVNVELNIYDDCSTDNTYLILKEYESKYDNINIFKNENNKNFTYNFIDALFTFKDNNDYEFYAFADQDDYWQDTKLIHAIKMIEQVGKCSLYSSNLQLADSMLNNLGMPYRPESYKPEKHDEVRYNIVTGCTMVFDKDCKNVFTKHYPKDVEYHDHWFGLIANYVEGCHYIYDSNPNKILYRQHAKNSSGGYKKVGLFTKLKQRFGKRPTDFKKLKQFLFYYSDEINNSDKNIIERFINYRKFKNKINLLKNFKTTNLTRFKISLLINKFIDKEV